MNEIKTYEGGKNIYSTEKGREKVLKRFSMFDGTGVDLTTCNSYEEAMATANLDYTGEKRKLFLEDGTEVKNSFCVVKSDDPTVQLGVVGKDYAAVHNREAFSIAEQLFNMGEMRFEVGGPSIGAKRTTDYSKSFLVMRGDDIKVEAVDTEEVFNPFVVFNNSFNGSSGVQYRVLLQRLVCLNGMTRYLGDKKNQLFITVQHSRGAIDKIKIAHEALLNRQEEIRAIKAEIEAFANTPFTKAEFDKEIIPRVIKMMKLKPLEADPETVTAADLEKRDLTIQRLWNAYHAQDTENYNNTVYKVALAMSDFETHVDPLRDTQNPSLYMNRCLQGFVLTTGVMKYIAETRGIKVKY